MRLLKAHEACCGLLGRSYLFPAFREELPASRFHMMETAKHSGYSTATSANIPVRNPTNGILRRRQREQVTASRVLRIALTNIMVNSSQIPMTGLHEVRSDQPATRTVRGPRAVISGNRATASDNAEAQGGAQLANGATNNAPGPRKLVRPTLPVRAFTERGSSMRSESPLLAHQTAMATTPADESSHAEAFYFQKQIQTQTLMAFVLEDGEQIEGYIEWYDRNVIKVRNGSRTLIYKSSIKYLHKVSEAYGQ